MREHYPAIAFERYADDIVVHCRSRQEVESIQARIERRLAQCRLAANPDKTRVVYCKDTRRTGEWACQNFDFLGYTFRPRSSRNYRGELFVSFSPAMSRQSARRLRQIVRRRWRLTRRTHLSLNALARQLNPIISGWINYYGRFRRSEFHAVLNRINFALTQWAMRKYKRLARRRTRAFAWLRAIARRNPSLFVHWRYQAWMTRAV